MGSHRSPVSRCPYQGHAGPFLEGDLTLGSVSTGWRKYHFERQSTVQRPCSLAAWTCRPGVGSKYKKGRVWISNYVTAANVRSSLLIQRFSADARLRRASVGSGGICVLEPFGCFGVWQGSLALGVAAHTSQAVWPDLFPSQHPAAPVLWQQVTSLLCDKTEGSVRQGQDWEAFSLSDFVSFGQLVTVGFTAISTIGSRSLEGLRPFTTCVYIYTYIYIYIYIHHTCPYRHI